MKQAMRILARGAAPMALAMAAVGVLGTAGPAVSAAPESAAAVSDAAVVSPLPTWGYTDPRHRTNRDSCRRGGGREQYDNGRRHWFCHGGRMDQDWY